jgi:membrane protein YdbS with pleckstrin-like domain
MREETPTVGSAGASRLPAGAVRYWNTTTIVSAIVFAATATGVALWVDRGWVSFLVFRIAIPLAAVLAVIDCAFMNRRRFRNYSYTVTPDFVYVARGKFFRRTLAIATPNILNVEIAYGPLLRAQGLATVQFASIVGSTDLGPVTAQEADRIRQAVLVAPLDAAHG